MAEDVWEQEPFAWDLRILEFAHARASATMDSWMLWVSSTGYLLATVVLPVAIVVLLLALRWFRDAFFLTAATLGASVLVMSIKLALRRDRPDLWTSIAPEASYSFPSGHAMTSATVGLALILLTRQFRLRGIVVVAGVLFVLLIGFSRVYLGVHYPSDVLAGWMAAVAWALGLRAILSRGRPPGEPSTTKHQTHGHK